MVALGLGAWLTYALLRWNQGETVFAGLTALEWTCVVVIAGCVQTSAQRLGRILRALEKEKRLMSPGAALHDPVFRAYLGIVLGAARRRRDSCLRFCISFFGSSSGASGKLIAPGSGWRRWRRFLFSPGGFRSSSA